MHCLLDNPPCLRSQVYADEGGVLWPQLHLCPCSEPWDKLIRPEGCKWVVGGCWGGGGGAGAGGGGEGLVHGKAGR